jgi:hypothetical protein
LALADDTLEAPLLGDAQQRQAIFERFGQRDGRAAEPLKYGPEARLALHQRLRTKIAAIERKQVERPQVDSARPGPTHVQPGEVRSPVGIAGHNLAVEHYRSGRQFLQQLRD